ncbi:MAG TPA: hypothetical protein VIT45_16335 [Allosphingosinicella sp.]
MYQRDRIYPAASIASTASRVESKPNMRQLAIAVVVGHFGNWRAADYDVVIPLRTHGVREKKALYGYLHVHRARSRWRAARQSGDEEQ